MEISAGEREWMDQQWVDQWMELGHDTLHSGR